MSTPFIGEIRMLGTTFAPAGWAECNGQLLPISENDTLFALLGTVYGGDGEETFGLPDLQGRVPVHVSPSNPTYIRGEKGGVEAVTLTVAQMPAHNHAPTAAAGAGGGTTNTPTNATILADSNTSTTNPFLNPSAGTQIQLHASTIGFAGGSQPHDNIQPTLAITYVISLFGIYPSNQ